MVSLRKFRQLGEQIGRERHDSRASERKRDDRSGAPVLLSIP